MARNDGIDRTVARNQDLETPADVAKVQEHNEREKDSYSNQDIVPERTSLNVHFKAPTDDYVKMFEQMEQDGVISTRGLKPDAVKYGELVFDVNSAYFYNHGGYEFAKQFYADAYKAAAEIVGGEQYILSAVMHADERNRAMSEALGEDVYHYHLHVVYIPVVEKQILWSKRCKDEALRGTVKEVITQVSRSKKWESKPVLDEDGNPMLNARGKKILRSSYSVLQDDFFHFMRVAGYTDLERGERGSTEEHLTVTQSGDTDDIQTPSAELNNALRRSAAAAGIPLIEGNIHSSDVFYRQPSDARPTYWERLRDEKGCLAVEMESFALFHNAKVLGKRAACLLTISDSFVSPEITTAEQRQTSFTAMMQVALGVDAFLEK